MFVKMMETHVSRENLDLGMENIEIVHLWLICLHLLINPYQSIIEHDDFP